MNLDTFCQTIRDKNPPTELDAPLLALWYDAQGDWDKAHDFAQRDNDSSSAWVHAYLHRKEDDLVNAGYWYTRANRTTPSGRLDEEWKNIAETLLGQADLTAEKNKPST